MLAACGARQESAYEYYDNPYTRAGTTQAESDRDYLRCVDTARDQAGYAAPALRVDIEEQRLSECMKKKGYELGGN